jgi:hypothetical protein
MPTNDDAAPAHECPGIRIHVIDIVHPPTIAIPPFADIELHQTIVTAMLTANNNATTARNVLSEVASATFNTDLCRFTKIS